MRHIASFYHMFLICPSELVQVTLTAAKKQRLETQPEELRLLPGQTVVSALFPFSSFFADAPQPLFCGDYEKDLEVAEGCFRRSEKIRKGSPDV